MSAKEPIRTEDLARLYDEHSAAVHRLAYSLLSQQQEAEDLTHDVFLLLQRGGFDSDRSSIRSYLLLLTRSMGLNRLNQRLNRRRILQCFRPGCGQHDPVDLHAIEARIHLERALAQLSTREQQILAMNYRENISQSTIASTLDLPLGTVKTISRRALLKLREALSPQQEG
ncbi:sigma-70 family RNA polymerase sigma factor [Synechococcus sp. ROS8604]|uniref:sigma-70 family RNA polymerase sigma factor n=1 Tax=Synechococcus sp. ROS8604 TaxID=1442557 RepID=UPI001643FF9B|nr:sigma-70 family RNA polymerase sigma factor [Synechococcus sp. ROS8604]QNI88630.1 RNA polymerase sigma factor/ type III (ECF-like) [Synechococcus sp. ROS8604]